MDVVQPGVGQVLSLFRITMLLTRRPARPVRYKPAQSSGQHGNCPGNRYRAAVWENLTSFPRHAPPRAGTRRARSSSGAARGAREPAPSQRKRPRPPTRGCRSCTRRSSPPRALPAAGSAPLRAMSPYEVVSAGDASTAENAADDDAKHGGVDVSHHGVDAEQKTSSERFFAFVSQQKHALNIDVINATKEEVVDRGCRRNVDASTLGGEIQASPCPRRPLEAHRGLIYVHHRDHLIGLLRVPRSAVCRQQQPGRRRLWLQSLWGAHRHATGLAPAAG